MARGQKVQRKLRTVGVVGMVLVSAFLVAGTPVAGARPAVTSSDQVWYWTEQLTADSLYTNGIDWSTIRRHDALSGDTCWGLGYPLANSGGPQHFRYFWCEAAPSAGAGYNIVVNVVGQAGYTVNFAGYNQPPPEYWTPKYVADALVANGIRWGNSLDPVTSDSCRGFGRSSTSGGVNYYKDFFCTIGSTARQPYFAVVNVDAMNHYSVHWVDYDVQPQVAPAAPAATTTVPTAPSGGTATPGTPPGGAIIISNSATSAGGGTIVNVGGPSSGGVLDPLLDVADQLCQGRSNSCDPLHGSFGSLAASQAAAVNIWTRPNFCVDPRDGHYYWGC